MQRSGRFRLPWPTVLDDRCNPALLVVALAGLGLGALCALTLVALVPFPVVPPPSSGVVGFTTVRRYPKSREAVYYALIIGMAAVAVAGCLAGMVSSVSFNTRRGADAVRTAYLDAAAHLPMFFGLSLALLEPSGVGLTLLMTVVAFGAAKLAVLSWPIERPAALRAAPAPAEPRAVAIPSWLRAERAMPVLTVALAGVLFGWLLPLAAAARSARHLVATAWVWPILLLAAWAGTWFILKRRGSPPPGSAARAALPVLPLLSLSLAPFLIDYPGGRRCLLVAAILLAAGVLAWVLRRPRPGGWEGAAVRAAGLAGLTVAAMAFVWEPDFPGLAVPAGDGDHLLAFLNDGLHGRTVYRDFWYPYGPLFYLLELWAARVGGVGAYYMPAWMVTVSVATLALGLTSRMLFLTWPVRVMASLTLFLFWTPLTVQCRIYGGYFAAVAAAAAATSPGAAPGLAAGGIASIAFLFSHEAGVAAVLGAQLAFLWEARRSTLGGAVRAYAGMIWPFVAGLLAVLAVAAAVALARGALGGYIRSTFGFVAVNDAFGGLPFPNLREELATGGQSPYLRLQRVARFLLESDVFRYFYLPVLVYLMSLTLVVVRTWRGRRPLRQDTGLLALAGFGLVLYRVALGRSDVGHAQMATVPALALGWALLERAGLGAARAVRAPRGRAFHSAEVALLVMGGSFLAWSLRLQTLPDLFTEVTAKMQHYHELRHEPRPTPHLHAVLTPAGDRLLYRGVVGQMVQGTLDYLKSHTAPGEGVYAFPYAFRYNTLLDRPTPVPFGPCLWSAAARTTDQRRLIDQLESSPVRYVVYDESESPDLDAVPTGDRFARLADYFFQRYAPELRIGGTLVLRRRDSPEPPPPSILDVASDEHRSYLHRGWYYPTPLEAPTGPPATVLSRWTAPHATARLNRLASHRELFVDALLYRPPDNPRRWLTATVGGRALAPLDLSARAGWTTLRFPLSPEVPEGPVLVELDTDPFPAADARVLGILVTRLGFD